MYTVYFTYFTLIWGAVYIQRESPGGSKRRAYYEDGQTC